MYRVSLLCFGFPKSKRCWNMQKKIKSIIQIRLHTFYLQKIEKMQKGGKERVDGERGF